MVESPIWITCREFAKFEKISKRAVLKAIHRGGFKTEHIRQVNKIWQLHFEALSPQGKEGYWNKYGRLVLSEATPQPSRPLSVITAGMDEAYKKAELENILFTQETSYADKLQIAKELGVSIKTIYYWLKKGRRTSKKEILPPIMREGRGRAKGELWKFPLSVKIRAVELYAQPYQPTAQQVWEQLCYEIEGEKPSLRTVQQWIKEANCEKPAEICFLRQGEKKWADKYAPSIRRDWSIIPAGDVFVGDHHEFDCFVIAPDGKIKRPWLTAWMDGHSRALVGYTINFQPCALEIALALSKAIFPEEDVPWKGLPNCLYVDNGKDYKSHLLNGEAKTIYKATPNEREWGLMQELGITMRHAQKYHAQSKHIERFFGTLERGWVNMLPGWCGHNTTVRPEKLKNEINKTQLWLDSGGTEGEKLLLFWWEFEEEISMAINDYNNHPHRSLNYISPVQAYELHGLPTVKMPKKDTFELLILPSVTRKIQTDGIHLFNNRYNAPALLGREGQTVEIRYNPHNLKEIIVLKDAEYICRAQQEQGWSPFAEQEEEKSALAEFLAGRNELRKAYRDKRDLLSQQDPRCYARPVVAPFGLRKENHIPAVNRYDKAGKEVKEENTAAAKVENALILFKYQKNRVKT